MMTQNYLGYSMIALKTQRMRRVKNLVCSRNFLPTHYLQQWVMFLIFWSILSQCSITGCILCILCFSRSVLLVQGCITVSLFSLLPTRSEYRECWMRVFRGWWSQLGGSVAGKEWNCGNIGKTWPDSQSWGHTAQRQILLSNDREVKMAKYLWWDYRSNLKEPVYIFMFIFW